MRRSLPLALTLLLGACADEPTMTFGLQLRAVHGDAPEQLVADWCLAPGLPHGGVSASSIDMKIDEPPPHLFIEADPDGEQDVFRVQVYSAWQRDDDNFWWLPDEVLAERSYDSAFGSSGGRDSFVVDFDGQQYTVEVLGLPGSASCP